MWQITKPQIFLLACGAFTLRAIISLQSYSGFNKPPMYGDFEAQRHWQEVTINLPIADWYTNTSDNDLMYWGLDYPPLTAYHSFINGWVAQKLNASYVELHTSRGITTEEHHNFMRNTVLVADFLLYIPALIIAVKSIGLQWHPILSLLSLIVVLFYPGQIIIDNGHFQYNNISLGFAALAIAAIFRKSERLAAVLFVLALNYKQMELYHALPFFLYLLGHSFTSSKQKSTSFSQRCVAAVKNVAILGLIVLFSFALIWAPWLRSIHHLKQLLHRLFPVARGVFEDKVSNVWCVVNVFYKLKMHFTNEQMAIACLISTLIAILPSSIHLLLNPRKEAFLLSLINSALAFFLFSFQVHEKSILLVTLPVMLYFRMDPLCALWFLHIATFSMLPLLVLDQLIYPTVVLTSIYLMLIRVAIRWSVNDEKTTKLPLWDVLSLSSISDNKLFVGIFYMSTFVGCSLLVVGQVFVRPPNSLPFLFPLLISAYSCAHFVLFFIYFNIRQIFGGATVKIDNVQRVTRKTTSRVATNKKSN
ncbi:probable dolichyl pyrophosphate Man9GlcNAc2 alpha-1,3-glucosyltransferase [Sitodiplosis mosellana]|uniref:probable dolichyl pyrophosphate Man9GlcNAc2 alpha-1,3-glucosyltransferase n=1 Tax=Sitodiplosis mosellana TaxID=263140 RepID=UPI0024446DF8|nr:probable dolichyl pyrophosphate Man9GlcNAc2 alpha-1,3-glucosyltransferase [Sitodiplosis mosellana]XP_055303008.1 probable dolichyl pyrophosphate Man9GlcNAc2 alpha-1,3-glucosyltransferase [Sitodiplosis mosellana]